MTEPEAPTGFGPRRPPRRGDHPEAPAAPVAPASVPPAPVPAAPVPPAPVPPAPVPPDPVPPAPVVPPVAPSVVTPTAATGPVGPPGMVRVSSGTQPSDAVAGLARASRADRRRLQRQREIRRNRMIVGGGVLVALVLVMWGCSAIGDDGSSNTASQGENQEGNDTPAATEPESPDRARPSRNTTAGSTRRAPGEPWSTEVVGQLTFRGNPTRSYYGLGPVPKAPEGPVALPRERRHVRQLVGGRRDQDLVRHRLDGPAAVFERRRPDLGRLRRLRQGHPLPRRRRPARTILGNFDMGDIIKGSVTRDPDGYPLLYSGSRADFHILATDRPDGQPASLWSMTRRRRVAHEVEQRLGQLAAGDRRLPLRGRRERPVVTSSSSTGARAPTAWSRSTRRSCSTRPAGTTSCSRTWPGPGSRVNDVSIENSRRHLGQHRLLLQLGRPASRAGTSPG